MDWVGAECHARSMARFWRLIIRRLRMRSIMLMAVLTSRAVADPIACCSSSVLSQLCRNEGKLPNNYGVTPRTYLRIEGREFRLPNIRKQV